MKPRTVTTPTYSYREPQPKPDVAFESAASILGTGDEVSLCCLTIQPRLEYLTSQFRVSLALRIRRAVVARGGEAKDVLTGTGRERARIRDLRLSSADSVMVDVN